MLTKLTCILTLFILYSCSNNPDYKLLSSNYSHEKISLQIKSVHIPIDSLGMTYYRKISLFREDSTNFLVGYHKVLHALDVYDLDGRKFIKRIYLAKEGPDKINDVVGLYAVNFDTIFINDYFAIVLIDDRGSIKEEIPISDKKLFTQNKIPYGTLTSTLNFGVNFLPGINSFLLFFSPASRNLSQKAAQKIPFAAELSLNGQKLTLLPLKYSPYYYKSKEGWGNMYQPNLTVYKDLIIFNFPIEPNIYSYNLVTGKFNKYGAQSKLTQNLSEPFTTGSDPNMYIVKNTLFFKTIYDPYRNLYYRIHWGKCKIKKNATEFNTPYDKKLYLMVFDNSFKIIKEIQLSEYTYLPYGYFCTEEGLFISSAHPLNKNISPNYLSYDLYKFKKESF